MAMSKGGHLVLGAILIGAVMLAPIFQSDGNGSPNLQNSLHVGCSVRDLGETNCQLRRPDNASVHSVFVGYVYQNVAIELFGNHCLQLINREAAASCCRTLRADNCRFFTGLLSALRDKNPRIVEFFPARGALDEETESSGSRIPIVGHCKNEIDGLGIIQIRRKICLNQRWKNEGSLRQPVSSECIGECLVGVVQSARLQTRNNYKQASEKIERNENFFEPISKLAAYALAVLAFWILASHFRGSPLSLIFWFLMYLSVLGCISSPPEHLGGARAGCRVDDLRFATVNYTESLTPLRCGGTGGGQSVELNLDPLLIALLKKIPDLEKGWPAAQRVRWFKTFAMNVSQIYDADSDPVEMKIEQEAAN